MSVPGASGRSVYDATRIHPELFDLADAVLAHAGAKHSDVGMPSLKARLSAVPPAAEFGGKGPAALALVLAELARPREAADPRIAEGAPRAFRTGIQTLEQLAPGQELTGVVRNGAGGRGHTPARPISERASHSNLLWGVCGRGRRPRRAGARVAAARCRAGLGQCGDSLGFRGGPSAQADAPCAGPTGCCWRQWQAAKAAGHR